MKLLKPLVVFLLSLICGCNSQKQQAKAGNKTVEVIQSKGRFRLYRNGQPYVIKGVCVLDATYLRQAKESGANSIRTYGTDNAGEILDSAAALGLTVTLGLYLPHAAIDMDYRDQKAVALQIEQVRKEVMKYKNHPALLMWGIGNELGLYLKGTPNS
jgi:beta-galactosidase/beta-glucuronidase